MGAGAGAGFGARVTQPAQPRFKGHDWSKGPPVRRAGPAVAAARGSGVDTSRFVAPPSTTSAFGGGGAGNGGGAGEPSRSRAGSTGGGLGAAGARTLGTNGSPDGAGGAGMGANTWGGRRAGGGGGGGVSDGAGDTRRTSATRTTRTAAFGARIMGAGPSGIGASPALGGGDAERPRRREGGRDGGWGGASHGTGTGGGGSGGARKWGTNNRSVLSNTGGEWWSKWGRAAVAAAVRLWAAELLVLPCCWCCRVRKDGPTDANATTLARSHAHHPLAAPCDTHGTLQPPPSARRCPSRRLQAPRAPPPAASCPTWATSGPSGATWTTMTRR